MIHKGQRTVWRAGLEGSKREWELRIAICLIPGHIPASFEGPPRRDACFVGDKALPRLWATELVAPTFPRMFFSCRGRACPAQCAGEACFLAAAPLSRPAPCVYHATHKT